MNIGAAFDGNTLTTHCAIIGMTGSGKTGLGIVLLEEARRQGVPMIVLDPKGDLGNLLLNDPSEFHIWANNEQISDWERGVLGAGFDLSAPLEMDKVPARIFTPGATYGVPLAVLDSMDPPSSEEDRIEEASTMVSALLSMVGCNPNPMTEEHAVASAILLHHWSKGESPGLAHLVGSIMDPPVKFIGALPMATFISKTKRVNLGRKINTLLAAPSLKAWMAGYPMDPEKLLYGKDGSPRCTVLALSHLSEVERMFFVALLTSKLVSWMRRQPGTGKLRALLYMDEAFGFCPPTKNPPSKKPIMTLLKQARAHGLGVIMATQNPVDLDYKAMSNCGTWLVGTLRTKQDRARIVDAVGESAGLDKKSADRKIAALGKREFILFDAAGRVEQFSSRFALCLLRGPMTRDEISVLSGEQSEEYAVSAMTCWYNQQIEVSSLPGESEKEFVHRCERIVITENQPRIEALIKQYRKVFKKEHEVLADMEQRLRLNAHQMARIEDDGNRKIGLSFLTSVMGGRGASMFTGPGRALVVAKSRWPVLQENVRQSFVDVGRQKEHIEELEAELAEKIEDSETEAFERVLDIVEVK